MWILEEEEFHGYKKVVRVEEILAGASIEELLDIRELVNKKIEYKLETKNNNVKVKELIRMRNSKKDYTDL